MIDLVVSKVKDYMAVSGEKPNILVCDSATYVELRSNREYFIPSCELKETHGNMYYGLTIAVVLDDTSTTLRVGRV